MRIRIRIRNRIQVAKPIQIQPDPDLDPGHTFKLQKVEFLHEVGTVIGQKLQKSF
jgi:hypothetical protein